jgi:glycosyltransferase involved in cell wall biosynthesis
MGRGLDVVGSGPTLTDLRAHAGRGTVFHGAASEEMVRKLLESCSLVCVAAEEDFGMVAVEAQAAGKPVVAYRRGGACETIVDGLTGVLFDAQTIDDVITAISACDSVSTAPEAIAREASRFSVAAFRSGIRAAICEAASAKAAGERHIDRRATT